MVKTETSAAFDGSRFWKWFDKETARAKATRVGILMTASGYAPSHEGGGCLAWVRDLGDGARLMICDEGNGLGDTLEENYLVGLHCGEDTEGDEVQGLAAAVSWCGRAGAAFFICRKWVKRIGGGFHPDTAGFKYEPKLSAEACEEYEQDIERLFRDAPGDPYKYAVMTIAEARS
jgi:hypothetical protein